MKYFLIILTLYSVVSYGGFSTVDKSYSVVEDLLEIKNMPRVRSQGPVNDCWGFSAATVAQFNICKIASSDCANIPPNQEISPLSMVAWTHTNTKAGGVPETRNHRNIQFGRRGSTAAMALKTAREEFMFMAESCFPHEQFASKFGDEGDREVSNAFTQMEKEYNKYRTESGFCEDCLKGAASDLGIKLPEEFKKLMKTRKTFGEFLYNITIGNKCQDVVEGSSSPKFDMYPPDKANYNQMISKIKDVLKSGNPLAFDGICLKFKGNECEIVHSVVISGYRRVCKEGKCRDVLKVQNSWGAEWQKKFDDGWVSAEDLLLDVTNKPNMAKNTLSWYY